MICDNCEKPIYRKVFTGERCLGVDCGCYRARPRAITAFNPFADFQLEHVHGEDGKPLRVTSIRQLSEAEKRYDFASVILNQDHGNVDDAPQQRVMTVSDVYKRKFSRSA